MRSSVPQGLPSGPSSAATSSANLAANAAEATLAGILFAPSCMALAFGADSAERAGVDNAVGGRRPLVPTSVAKEGGGADAGRSVAEPIVLCMSAVASCNLYE
jgi:hypothetical protein